MYEEVDILGYTVSKKGFLPRQETVKAILEFKRPNCIRRVRQFLGVTGFFRKHIRNYAKITVPLTELIKQSNQNLPFTWTQECEESFTSLKQLLTNPPLLHHWDDNKEAVIFVDSSLYAMGGVLLQTDTDTEALYPIAYLSKKYTDTQRRYSNAEREMLALVYTVNNFREYVMGRQVTVYTDCQALVYYKNFKDTSSRLNRLSLTLVDYDLIVKYRKGTNNLMADGLSRNPVEETLDEDLLEINLNLQEIKEENFEHLQEMDEYLREIKLAKMAPDQVDRKIRRDSRLYEEKDGILYYKTFNGNETKFLLAIPNVKKQEILKLFHDNKYSGGHFSDYKTLAKIKERYYWPEMAKDVTAYVKTCKDCQLKRTKTYKGYGKLQPQIPSTKPFERIIIDFLGPITQSNGYKYILVTTDVTTRMVFTTPTRSADAKTVAKALLSLFCIFGYPRTITHDQGTHFMGNVLKQLLLSIGIEQRASPPYMHQIQGLTERMNLVIKKVISHYIEQDLKTWSQVLKYVTFAYNTSKQSSTGYTPFYLMFGREANLPSDYMFTHEEQDADILEEIKLINKVRQDIPKILEKAQNKQKSYYDQTKRDLNLQVGDLVLVAYPKDATKPYSKFQNTYKGPYTVVSKINDLTYLIRLYKKGKLVEEPIHVANLKPYFTR